MTCAPTFAAEAGGGLICLPLGEIDHTEVKDDHTILFTMRDAAVWENLLPENCQGLKAHDGFEYSGIDERICSRIDLIRIADEAPGCALGDFTLMQPGKRK